MLADSLPGYAELHAISNFTFLRGASHPEELVAQAAELGYWALAITDECSFAGVVRAHTAAHEAGLDLLIGTELELDEGHRVVLLATDRAAYGRLAQLITRARRSADKGQYRLGEQDLEDGLEGCLALLLRARAGAGSLEDDSPPVGLLQVDPFVEPRFAHWLAERFPQRCWLAVELCRDVDDARILDAAIRLGEQTGLRLVATGDVHMHVRSRRVLADTVSAIRIGRPVAEAGFELAASGERHLRARQHLAAVYPPELLAETLVIASRCRFSLDELRYEYPEEIVPGGLTPTRYLRQITEEGVERRWPWRVPAKVRAQIEHELALIEELGYQPYFLTVYDIVRFARSAGILCQGRGSAANSAVCFCLGITEVDPARMNLLFERFISRERNEPPDIDVDFEHERREEVIQYIYEKYGRDRAAITATVITYQPRSAVRDISKALGLDAAQADRLAKSLVWWDGRHVLAERFGELGFDAESPLMQRLAVLVDALIGFPRHLSQHTGGFVISRGALSALVPIENASMPDRTVIQWDKDDLEALGLLKVDVLALGMLSAIRRSFDLIAGYRGRRLSIAEVPSEDPAVYEMIQRADTVGVFQIESRAQMAMLPRLRPRTFYDLVIEVAIVRPGPIQGGMVHPYLRRRQGLEPVTYPSEAVREVLKRTLGVPIFQEQVMQLAVAAAGFTPGEADQLRRAMAAWRRRGGLERFELRLIEGMRDRGYEEEFARQIFHQIKGFGEYGFPESHSASFALLVYVSCWLKHHEPAAFTCALLNSQPMGFYPPSQLVRDARRHGVEVRAVDVRYSDWDCTLEPSRNGEPSLRLGFRLIKGFREESAVRIMEVRQGCARSIFEPGTPSSRVGVEQLAHRTGLSGAVLKQLAAAGALAGLAGHRHRAHWDVAGVEEPSALFADPTFVEGTPLLAHPTEGEDLVEDYRRIGLTLGRHPLELLRQSLDKLHLLSAVQMGKISHGGSARAVGLVVNRQRPSTASGVIFMTLEDETGYINVVVWPWVVERQRREVLQSRLLAVYGTVEREGDVVHLIAGRLVDHSALLGDLATRSRDFH